MARIQTFQLRRGTAAAWASTNPTLAVGEPGLETDTRRLKFGDGSTVWTALPYATAPPAIVASFSIAGAQAVRAVPLRWYNPTGRTLTITKIQASAGTAPTGAALIVDVNKNGTSIWATNTGNRAQVAASSNTGTQTSFDTTSVADGDYLTVDVDQVGSSVAGADLVVEVVLA